MKSLSKFIIFSFIFLAAVAFAETPDPLKMLRDMASTMISELKKKSEAGDLRGNTKVVKSLVDSYLLPHVDVDYMAKRVIGRNGWMAASGSDQKDFSKEFTNTVIGTYSSALSSYTNERMEFNPIRGGYEKKECISVSSRIIRQQGPLVPVDYRLCLQGDEWKIVDFAVEGVSIINSFRSQFQPLLGSGKSLKDIAVELKTRNGK